ncbi:hypothetical protein LguiA_034643 [Lonicera macranthoides]
MEVEQLPHLPHKIVVVILSRLPVKSLLRFKGVCKKWCFTIFDSRFVKCHLLNQVSRRRERIMLSSNPYELVNLVYFTDFESPYGYHPLERIDFPFMDSEPIGDIYGSCNGLVLIVYEVTLVESIYARMQGNSLPSLDKARYDSTTDDYKLVVLIFVDEPFCSFVIFAFSLKANRWKERTEICKYEAALRQTRAAAALVNGSLHWMMLDCDDVCHSFKVACFNLADEKLKGMELPSSLETVDKVSHFLGVLGGCLCALTVDRASVSRVVNVWVMKEYGMRESWTNLINFTYFEPFGTISPFCFTKGGDIVVDIPGEKLFLVNGERKVVGSIPVSMVHFMPFTYMESLVSVYGSYASSKRGTKRKTKKLPQQVAPSNEEQTLIVHAAQNLSQEVDPQASVPVEDECWPYTWSITPGIISPLENVMQSGTLDIEGTLHCRKCFSKQKLKFHLLSSFLRMRASLIKNYVEMMQGSLTTPLLSPSEKDCKTYIYQVEGQDVFAVNDKKLLVSKVYLSLLRQLEQVPGP